MTGPAVQYISSNLINRTNLSNLNYDMSIKNCQVSQKSCLDRINASCTLGSKSESMVCDT